MENLKVVVLAAGQGTRMKSEVPKVLHRVFDKTMVDYVIEASYEAGASEVCVVVGHQSAMVKAVIKDKYDNVSFAVQKEQLGTGHAVMQAKDFIQSGNILVLCGDTPLIKGETIKAICDVHESQGNDATVVSMIADNPTGYGRIIRNGDAFAKIVEQKDANDEEKAVKEVNTGVYIFKAEALNKAFESLTNNNAQGEYYLTDTLEILLSAGKKIGGYAISDNDEIRGINDRVQLNEAEKIMQKRINEYHMRNGVTMRNPESVYIEDGVEIGNDTEICQNVTIKSGTKIGSDCVIGSGSMLNRAVIHDGVDVLSSVILESEVDEGTHVGPFAYIRPNCHVGKEVKVGDFVELKNSNIDDGTKISHLTSATAMSVRG